MTRKATSASPLAAVQGLTDRIDFLRRQAALLRERRQIIAAAPRDLAEAEAALDEMIKVAASKVRPRVGYLALDRAGGHLELLADLRRFAKPVQGTDPTVIELLAAVLPEQMRVWLVAQLRQHYASLPESMAAAERQAELARLDGEITALEAEEVQILWSLEDSGFSAPWRGDLPPHLVLGLESRT